MDVKGKKIKREALFSLKLNRRFHWYVIRIFKTEPTDPTYIDNAAFRLTPDRTTCVYLS